MDLQVACGMRCGGESVGMPNSTSHPRGSLKLHVRRCGNVKLALIKNLAICRYSACVKSSLVRGTICPALARARIQALRQEGLC